MKKEIHPQYNTAAKATCACGHTFEVGSTLDSINVEVCSNCHPFYTGEEKAIDTAGRVEKFKTRRKVAESAQADAKKREEIKAEKEKENKKKEDAKKKAEAEKKDKK